MVTKKTDKPMSYFERQLVSIEKSCKGKTKDNQIKWLKRELADSNTVARMSLDGWGSTMKAWSFWGKISMAHIFIAFLLGICWGIILFT